MRLLRQGFNSSRNRLVNWLGRAAILVMVFIGLVIIARHSQPGSDGITTIEISSEDAALYGQQPTPIPVTGRPVITAENAGQLTEIRRYGTGTADNALWSPDGKTIVMYGFGIWLYDAETLTELDYFDLETYVYDAAYSPDSTLLAITTEDGVTQLLDAQTGDVRSTIDMHGKAAGLITFSPDGTTVATTDGDPYPVVRIWDVSSGREKLTLGSTGGPGVDIAFSPDGTLLAASGRVSVGSYPAVSEVDGIRPMGYDNRRRTRQIS